MAHQNGACLGPGCLWCDEDEAMPPIEVWREYNQRKADLFRELGHGVEYDRALRDLIDELGI